MLHLLAILPGAVDEVELVEEVLFWVHICGISFGVLLQFSFYIFIKNLIQEAAVGSVTIAVSAAPSILLVSVPIMVARTTHLLGRELAQEVVVEKGVTVEVLGGAAETHNLKMQKNSLQSRESSPVGSLNGFVLE